MGEALPGEARPGGSRRGFEAGGRTVAAAACWLVAAASYIAGEAVAASAFPGYSYARNYISDLGVPYPALYDGRALDSRLAVVMNATFVAQGALFATAALLVAASRPRRTALATAALSLALVYAVGVVLVGAVHIGPRSLADGTLGLHVAGAAMAIGGGNGAIILAGLAAARHARAGGSGGARAFRAVSVALGALGLAALGLLVGLGATARPPLPFGAVERASVYTITAWEVVAGAALLLAPRRRRAGTLG